MHACWVVGSCMTFVTLFLLLQRNVLVYIHHLRCNWLTRGRLEPNTASSAFLLFSSLVGSAVSNSYFFVSVNSNAKIILVTDFILAYTIVGLELHFFSTKGVHVTSLEDYHKSRTSAKFETLFVILYLQVRRVYFRVYLCLIVNLILAVSDSSSSRVLECDCLCLDKRGLPASDENTFRHQWWR